MPLETVIWGLFAGVQGRTEQFRRDIDDGNHPLVGHPRRTDDAQDADHLVVHHIRRGHHADVVENPVARFLADENLDPVGPEAAVEQPQDVVLLVERLKRLFEAFNEKHDILRLLDSCLRADGIQIFIGQESGYRILDDISVVTAPYTLDNRVVGVLGIIGPTRMAYERVIPIVDLTAKLLGSALNARK